MGNLVVLMVILGVGIGGFIILTSFIFLIVAMCVSDTIRRRNILIIAGKFLVAGILLFAVGFGSCAVLFQL